MTERKNHPGHYLFLLIVLALALLGYAYFSYERTVRIFIVLLAVLAYVFWGIIHHYGENRLGWKIILEYFLLGLIILSAFSLVNIF